MKDDFRPFKTTEEVFDTISEFNPFSRGYSIPLVWVRHVASGNLYLITGYCKEGVMLDTYVPFETLADEYEFLKGQPCGVPIS